MVSEVPSQPVIQTGVVVPSVSRNCPGKKNQVKVPKKIHKAEREKLKREHLNDLFLDLENALELTEPNNGKASILCEASRLLKDLFGKIECLRKEHASLLSESRYVDIEKNELREETSALASQIEKLQSELQERAANSKPDLNISPPAAFLQQETTTSHLSEECLRLPVMEPAMQQAHAVLIVPMRPDLPAYPMADAALAPTVPTSHVSKPHARYPTPADSWPAGLLRSSQTTEPSKEFLAIGCKSVADMGERGSDKRTLCRIDLNNVPNLESLGFDNQSMNLQSRCWDDVNIIAQILGYLGVYKADHQFHSALSSWNFPSQAQPQAFGNLRQKEAIVRAREGFTLPPLSFCGNFCFVDPLPSPPPKDQTENSS